jgi:hypothetical protein
MKKNLIIIFLLLVTITRAQIHEIGVFAGGANFIGDIGKTTYVDPEGFSFGILYKWNKSPRHAYRFSYTQGNVYGNDLASDVPSRVRRGYRFKNTIKEISIGLEFNFFDFNLHEMEQKITPYAYSGIAYTIYDGLFFVGNTPKSDASHGTPSLPMVVGVKSNITPHLIIGAEIGVRYTLADDIDGSFPTNENLQNLVFGNTASNDWYVFSGFTLTYTFGQKPCYCRN